jgi:hypothetical protein
MSVHELWGPYGVEVFGPLGLASAFDSFSVVC